MSKAIIAAALGLTLSGCGSWSLAPINLSSTVSRNTLLGIESGYGIALSGERTYKALCADKSIPKSCRDIVARLQAADRKTVQAIHDAAKFIAAYPTVDSSNVIAAAQAALDQLRAILGPTGVL